MADSYLGQIRIFAGTYAPSGWHFCDGSSLSIQEYTALYSLIGTTYGSVDSLHFSLPDLRDKVCIGQGQGTNLTNRTIGQTVGTVECTLQASNMPAHSHSFSASSKTATTATLSTGCGFGATATATNGVVATYAPSAVVTQTSYTALDSNVISPGVGGAQPHENMMPYMAINYIICIDGLFPHFP